MEPLVKAGHEYLESIGIDTDMGYTEYYGGNFREAEFIKRFGRPSPDTWSLDYTFIKMVLELLAGLDEVSTIINWEAEDSWAKYNIEIWHDEKNERAFESDVPLSRCRQLVKEYLIAYLLAEQEGNQSEREVIKLELAFAILGKILPRLWW